MQYLGGMERTTVRALLRVAASAIICLVPLYLLARASSIWNVNSIPTQDDFFFARLCLSDGLTAYVEKVGLYRILTGVILLGVNRLVIGGPVPLWVLSLSLLTVSTALFVHSCVVTGLPSARALVLFALLTSSPFLVETTSFWSAAVNQSAALIVLAIYLRAFAWAHGLKSPAGRILVVIGGTLLGMATYEMVVPFIVAMGVLQEPAVRHRIIMAFFSVCFLFVVVSSLDALGLYRGYYRWAFYQPWLTEPWAVLSDNVAGWSRRISVYGELLPSLLNTGFGSFWTWIFVGALGVLVFFLLSGSSGTTGTFELSRSVFAVCFVFSFVVGLMYLGALRSFTMRYLALVLIYGLSALAWMRGRLVFASLILVLVGQLAVVAGLPVHLRDAELAVSAKRPAVATVQGDIIVVEGRTTLGRWANRFVPKDSSETERLADEDLRDYTAGCARNQ